MPNIDFYGRALGSEFIVNTTTALSQSRPSIAALNDGGFVIVWVDASQALGAGTGTEIRGQRFNAAGQPVGGEFVVNEVIATQVSAPFVAATPGGGFVVTWSDQTGGIRTREFGSSGSAVSSETAVQDGGLAGGANAVAVDDAGNRLIVWNVTVAATESTPAHVDVRAKLIRSDGTSGAEFTLSTGNETLQTGVRVVALEGGGFMTVWHDDRPVNGQNMGLEVRGQRIDAAGNKVGAEMLMTGGLAGDQSLPNMVALANGGYALTWLDSPTGTTGNNTARVQRFDALGQRVGSEMQIALGFDGRISQLVIKELADGRLVATFTYSTPHPTIAGAYVTQSVMGQQFSADGQPLGEAFLVAAEPPPSRFDSAVAVLASGQVVAAWTDNALDTSGSSVRARLFDPLTYTLGTDVADTINGTAAEEIIEGLGGNDVINGGGDDDMIDGGAGADDLDGGAGDDLIYGDAGNDLIDGGEGSDVLRAGDGDDALTGGAGYDSMYGGEGNDQISETGDDYLGTEGLFGEGGDDVLTAANGGFFVFGGAGNDRITVTGAGGATTWVEGDAGNDIIIVSGIGTTTAMVGGGDGNDDITIGGFTSVNASLGEGNDILRLDAGNFIVTMGGGTDFILPTVAAGQVELIGFTAGDLGDHLDLSVYGADPFGTGVLTFNQRGPDLDIIHGATGRRYVLYNVQATQLTAANIGVTNPLNPPPAGEIVGTGGNDQVNGTGGDDILHGLGGNDILDGGAGADRMIGGLGNDIYHVDTAADVVEDSGGAFDSVYSAVSYALRLDSAIELLASALSHPLDGFALTGNDFIQSVIGNGGHNALYGLGGDDGLYGHDGVDIMDGGTGADVMDGGTGGDIYFVDNSGDVVIERDGEGSDYLYTGVSYALGAGSYVEFLATSNSGGTGAIDLAGSDRDNTITGNDGVNTVTGGGGSDNLRGLGGNDLLDGGRGQDFLEGGAGADTFRFEFTGDSALGAADAIFDFVSGTDKLDLALIDANSGAAGDQAFTFLGSAAFSGQAGQLRAESIGSSTHVIGDTNGDGAADLHIILYNTASVTAGDFVL